MWKNIYESSFYGGEELGTEGIPINWGMIEQAMVCECDGIQLLQKLTKRMVLEKSGKDLYELLQS